MRETHNAQVSIFEHCSNHEYGVKLRKLSEVLDRQPEILELVAADLIDASVSAAGRTGLSAESVLRCLVLRQQLGFSYEQLTFHLSDSVTYRTFARLPAHPCHRAGPACSPQSAASSRKPWRWHSRN